MEADGFHYIAAWMGTDPRTAAPLDEVVLQQACASVEGIVSPLGQSGHGVEARAAVVKALAAMEAAPLLDLSEADVHALSEKLRRMLYLEIMAYRRAFERDLKAGTL